MSQHEENIQLKGSSKRQSRLGIMSVIIAFALPVLLVVFIIIGLFLSLDREEWKRANEFIGKSIVISLSFPSVHLFGVILGVVGLFSRKTKKLFPIAGIILNGILMLIGAAIVTLLISFVSGAVPAVR